MAKTGSSFYFTEDIIFEILSWLPVISLLRCRAVCKLWRSIISNPQFVEAHLANSQKKQASVLRVCRIVRHEEYTVGNFNDVAFLDTRDDSVRLDLPPRFVGRNYHLRSCNGLVCLSNTRGEVIHLWNPSTKMFKKLPTPEIQARCFDLDLGFFYDSVSKDYKLLRIVLSKFSNPTVFAPVLEAELYSANTDSWKKIQVPKTANIFRPYPNSKCVLSKTGLFYMEGLYGVLLFDLRNEAIGVSPFRSSSQLRRSNLLDFNGNVGIISKSFSDLSVLSLWTLDDTGGKMSWTKKFNLESDLKLDWTSLYLGIGMFLAENNDVGYIFYDSRKKETTMLPNQADFVDLISVAKYSESLVSLSGFTQLE